MLLCDDARHPHPDREGERVAENEKRGGRRMHRSSMPEKRRRGHWLAAESAIYLRVRKLERRQQPVGVTPRLAIQQGHLSSGDDQLGLDRRGHQHRRDRPDERRPPKPSVPPSAHLADRYRRPDLAHHTITSAVIAVAAGGKNVDLGTIDQVDRLFHEPARSRKRHRRPVVVWAQLRHRGVERQKIARLHVQAPVRRREVSRDFGRQISAHPRTIGRGAAAL